MKRITFLIVTALLLVCLAFPAAYAEEIDLSKLSYDELIALQSKITLEIMSRPDFKAVKVAFFF